MAGAHSRTKGASYERLIAQFYRALGFPAKRTLQSREGFEGADVQGTPWWVECKRYKSIGKVMGWWEQARVDSERCGGATTLPPVLHIKEDHGPDLVVISLEMWEGMVKARNSPR
jgi:hypothetical protein